MAEKKGATTWDLLTVSQVAEELAVSRPMVYVLMDKGQLPFIYVGTRRRIRRADVNAYLTANFHGQPLAELPSEK
jgi:excisionase family DNA binding protein